MVGSLFTPGWQDSSAEKRAKVLQSMDPLSLESQAVFAEVIKDDPDLSVKLVAVSKVRDLFSLYILCQDDSKTELCAEAETALVGLVGSDAQLSPAEIRDAVSQHPEIGSLIGKFCEDDVVRNEIVSNQSSSNQAAMIADVHHLDTRLLIADSLEQEADLQLARNLLRGKDKNAEKIIRTKLDEMHALQRSQEEQAAIALEICEKMEFLAAQDWQSESWGQYSVWSQRWQALESQPSDEIATRYKKAFERMTALVDQHEQVDSALSQEETLVAEFRLVCEEAAILTLDQWLVENTGLRAKSEASKVAWDAANDIQDAATGLAGQYSLLQQSLQSVIKSVTAFEQTEEKSLSLLKSCVGALDWPAHYSDLVYKTELLAQIETLQGEVATADKAAEAKLNKLHMRLNRLMSSAQKGNLSKAKGELAALSKAIQNFSGKTRAALDDRFAQASEAVEKMSDWIDFATEPKYLALCESMESLLDSKLNADKLSKKISELQESWKALEQSPSADKHWKRFKLAGDKAYEPCAVFFKQRREVRKENLKKREPLVTKMRALFEETDWEEQPDYRSIEQALQKINQQWKKISEVEHGAGQKQWKRLSKLRDAVYEKLDPVYDENINAKKLLIEQVKSMLDPDLGEDALDKLKLYQSRWKTVGATRRKDDQAAWKKFKAATDLVYEQIKGVRKAKRNEQDAQLNGYRALSKQINQLAKQATVIADADIAFKQLKDDYAQLPPLPNNLPEKLVRGIQMDFERACQNVDKAKVRIKKESKMKVMASLAEKATLCSALEAQVGKKANDKKIEQLTAEINAIEICDRNFQQQFEKRLNAALDADRKEATEARHQMCIELEIALSVDSPAEDSALRMQMQLNRMKKHGIGQPQANSKQPKQQLQVDWYCMPGADPKTQKSLDARFLNLIKKHS